VSEYLTLTDDDDGKLFKVRVLNTGEERIARYHRHAIGDMPLKFPCFADPDHPEDYLRWLHSGWGARAISAVSAIPSRGDNLREAPQESRTDSF
jgi:hypothetical protein